MLENTSARNMRRLIILEGISQDLGHSEISAQLGANRWVVRSDIKYMQRNDDPGLILAEEDQAQIREKKVLLLTEETRHFKQNQRFQSMTGITLQEMSFRNMIDYNRHELLVVLRSDDQNAEIFKLSKSVQRTLKKNGIIIKRWKDNEITERAQEYLTIKNLTLEH
ncbi:hypothetical protein ISS40_11370 [Candidatus Bathyarchaeota archaeon]|nr:hypothetical protein [Candidatus Bathyarchaeota archaeon]